MSFYSLLAVLLLGLICALASILFCEVMHGSHKLFGRCFPNRYLRVAVGSALVVGVSLLLGTTRYNGAGSDVIAQAIAGTALPYDGLMKLLFTAITLGCGMKGGEIVPSFFVGATMGCLLGPLAGLSPSFGAALGMVGLFCGVVNCPIASMLLSLELFGGAGMPFFALVCAVSFACSGRHSLYSAQSFRFDKASI
jgi:H+/Cl- antiporter ClcA